MKKIEPICGNCLLFNPEKKECKAAILIEGKTYHLPVSPEDNCHMEELGIEINQVRWWVDENDKSVKIEYPEGFFGDFENK